MENLRNQPNISAHSTRRCRSAGSTSAFACLCFLPSSPYSSSSTSVNHVLEDYIDRDQSPLSPILRSPHHHPSPRAPLCCLDATELIIHRKLSEGYYADVYEANWCGEMVAVKSYHNGYYDLCEEEMSIHAKLQDPNVVRFVGAVKDGQGNPTSLVTELMDGTLQHHIHRRRSDQFRFYIEDDEIGNHLSIAEAVDFMLQIARGMAYLHAQGVMHRDLKSANILICPCKTSECVPNGFLHIKLADFGDAKTLCSSAATPNRGTLRWMAPEVYSVDREAPMKYYSCKADVFSFSILCYEILTGEVPFNGFTGREFYEIIGAGERPEFPSNCPPGLGSLINMCWESEACKRPSFEDIRDCLQCLHDCAINEFEYNRQSRFVRQVSAKHVYYFGGRVQRKLSYFDML
eukprot:Gb_27065 [translate_table: standard]